MPAISDIDDVADNEGVVEGVPWEPTTACAAVCATACCCAPAWATASATACAAACCCPSAWRHSANSSSLASASVYLLLNGASTSRSLHTLAGTACHAPAVIHCTLPPSLLTASHTPSTLPLLVLYMMRPVRSGLQMRAASLKLLAGSRKLYRAKAGDKGIDGLEWQFYVIT